jgi:hypothetical protein
MERVGVDNCSSKLEEANLWEIQNKGWKEKNFEHYGLQD